MIAVSVAWTLVVNLPVDVACRVREFEVKDVNPYPIDMLWDRNGELTRNHIFERYSAIPTTKQITTAYR